MTLTSTGDLLLRSILDNPAEDTPRLVYADWLAENGREEYAEFVRVQVELAKCRPDCGIGKVCRAVPDGFGKITCAGLRDRERDLWGSWPDENDVRSLFHNTLPRPDGVTGFVILPATWMEPGHYHGKPAAKVSRGFVSHITLTCNQFTADDGEFARRLFAGQPVAGVTLSDREPIDDNTFRDWNRSWDWVWKRGGGNDDRRSLPWDIWCVIRELLPESRRFYPEIMKVDKEIQDASRHLEFPTRDAALAALSAACVHWGRKLAGLSPLLEVTT